MYVAALEAQLTKVLRERTYETLATKLDTRFPS
jgi:hypothetical protein